MVTDQQLRSISLKSKIISEILTNEAINVEEVKEMLTIENVLVERIKDTLIELRKRI